MTELNVLEEKPIVSRWKRIRLTGFGLSIGLSLVLTQFLLSGCAVGDKAADFKLVPVTDSPTGVHYPGKFVWNDLLTDNVTAAKDFYGQLFGWTFETSGNYTVIKNNGLSIAGIAHIKGDVKNPSVSRWLCTLSVADVDTAVALTVEEGGVVNEGPLDLVNRGKGALIRDPQGAQLMLLYANNGDPEDGEPVLGEWLWHELWSNQASESLDFYQKLTGYDFEGDPADYLILIKDEQWRAGIRYLDNSELEMRWVPVVRVADTDEIAARAKQLGGKVLVDPQPTQDGGSVALLSDPSNALLIIQRWTAPTSGLEN
jgi:predicted enzyme related to lactoylglutathione lyase